MIDDVQVEDTPDTKLKTEVFSEMILNASKYLEVDHIIDVINIYFLYNF